jgi:hypothetical protein
VLQTCPSQRNALLSTLVSLDLCGLKVINFDITDVRPRLPYHVAFQIYVEYTQITIKCTIIDEGAAICMMSLTCWKSIGSPTLSQSMTMLTTFDGSSFRPHIILPSLLVYLGGKTMEVYVEVVDAPLGYNLILGRNWTYAMTTVVSYFFRTLCFSHEGKIMMIDQLSFKHTITNALVGSSIPVIDNSQQETDDVFVRMHSSLMGSFYFVAPIHHIHAISSESSLLMRSVPFHTSYFKDLWMLPSLTI